MKFKLLSICLLIIAMDSELHATFKKDKQKRIFISKKTEKISHQKEKFLMNPHNETREAKFPSHIGDMNAEQILLAIRVIEQRIR